MNVGHVLFVAFDEPGRPVRGKPQFLSLVEKRIVQRSQVLDLRQEPRGETGSLHAEGGANGAGDACGGRASIRRPPRARSGGPRADRQRAQLIQEGVQPLRRQTSLAAQKGPLICPRAEGSIEELGVP